LRKKNKSYELRVSGFELSPGAINTFYLNLQFSLTLPSPLGERIRVRGPIFFRYPESGNPKFLWRG
jgi:hypothetical protein